MATELSRAGRETSSESLVRVPSEPLGQLFLRFLRFGAVAWGGPVAQIAMIRQELVEEERWVTGDQFNRALAVYQVLPGPEAHELCVYFGMLSRGRAGDALAGLAFMLPGFVLMFTLSWAYVAFGLTAAAVVAVFATMQAAVAALMVRAVHRRGSHVVTDRWLWGIAIAAAAAQLAGVHFAISLATGGLLYTAAKRGKPALAFSGAVVFLCGAATWLAIEGLQPAALVGSPRAPVPDSVRQAASLLGLFWSGLKAGLLTFGGAYTVIPFLQEDAVSSGAWMTNAQFLDGLALSGLLPAPLIIFSTFVGYVGGGWAGALLMTVGIFLPAFTFTLLGHDALERRSSPPHPCLPGWGHRWSRGADCRDDAGSAAHERQECGDCHHVRTRFGHSPQVEGAIRGAARDLCRRPLGRCVHTPRSLRNSAGRHSAPIAAANQNWIVTGL